MATSITNTQVDTAASAVGLSRVTDVTTLRVAESDVPLEFTVDATGTTVWMTYDELSNSDVAARKIKEAEGVRANCQAIEAVIGSISFTNYDEAEYKAAVEDLRSIGFTRGFE